MQSTALHHLFVAGLRRTWLVAFVGVCAVFAAHIVAALVAASMHDADSPRLAPLPRVVHPAPPPLDPDAFVARNMFCSTCETVAGPGSTGSFAPNAVLIATSIGRDHRATLRVLDTDVQGSWGVGDAVPGLGTIERIGFVSIDVLAADGRRGKLSLFDGGRSDAGAATPAPAAAADPFADRIKKVGDNTFEVDRSLVRELVTGTTGAGGTRVMPVGKNGQLDGLRVMGVRPGSVAKSLGLETGDLLQAVNNAKIESANSLLDLYAQLGKLDTVELQGTRRGKPLAITLRLR